MKSLIDIFEPVDKQVKRDISRINNAIHSDMFLKALGNRAHEVSLPSDFPICQNYLKAAEMLVSESIYSTPKPWPYQCFMEIIEEENGRILFKSGLDSSERQKIRGHISSKTGDGSQFDQDLFQLIDFQYTHHQIDETLATIDTPVVDVEDWLRDPNVAHDAFRNEIEAWIVWLIDTSYFCGIDNSPFYQRICESFETGGIPAGWIGPKPDEGGKPKDCLQLLHYGSKKL